MRREADDRYFADFVNQMTDDGVSTVLPVYAFARSAINYHARVPGVSLTTFFATEPAQVTTARLPSGLLARDPQAGYHYRIEAVYPSGSPAILPVLFPHTVQQPLSAALARLTGENCHGARVGADDVLVSDGVTVARRGKLRFTARAVVSRDDGFFFARAGRSFRRDQVGFDSEKPVAIFMNGAAGAVTASEPSAITLHYRGVTGLRLGGSQLQPVATGENWIRFDLPAGRHTIELRN